MSNPWAVHMAKYIAAALDHTDNATECILYTLDAARCTTRPDTAAMLTDVAMGIRELGAVTERHVVTLSTMLHCADKC